MFNPFPQLIAYSLTARQSRPLSAQECETLLNIAQELCRRTAVPCTACHYCVEKCPQNLDIPALLALFNAQLNGEDAAQRIAALPEDRRPQSCRACRSCEKVCPQGIRISAALGQFSHLLHG